MTDLEPAEIMWGLLNRNGEVCEVSDRRRPLQDYAEFIFYGGWRNIRRRGDMSIRRVTVTIGLPVTCEVCRYGEYAGQTSAEPWSDGDRVIQLFSCRNGVRWWKDEPENPPWFGCNLGLHMSEEVPDGQAR